MNRMAKWIVSLALPFFFVHAADAQSRRNFNTISGVVLDEGSNRHVERAVVELSDVGNNLIEQSTTSDSGMFAFRGLQNAIYHLVIVAAGYERKEIQVDLSFTSDRGMTIFLKPLSSAEASAPGYSISSHELSMPEKARARVESARTSLYAKNKPEIAIKELQKAVSMAPDYYEAYRDMGIALVTLGKYADAIACFRQSIQRSHEKYGDAFVSLGTLLLERGNAEEGELSLRKGVDLKPASWLGFYELGKLELSRHHLDAALLSAQRATSIAPNMPITYRLLTNIHLQRGDFTGALADIDAFLRLEPNSPAGVRAAELRPRIALQAAERGQLPAEEKH